MMFHGCPPSPDVWGRLSRDPVSNIYRGTATFAALGAGPITASSTTLAVLSSAGFPNQFFNDSWVVGFWRGRPWVARRWIGKKSLDVGSSHFWIGWVIKRGGKCVRFTYRG